MSNSMDVASKLTVAYDIKLANVSNYHLAKNNT